MDKFPTPKTTRRWSISPNHQTSGSDPRSLADQSRQLFAGNMASLACTPEGLAEATAPTPMERVAQFAVGLTHTASRPGATS